METDTKFRLMYYVDGQEYKTYEIQAAEVVTPEPDPYKEGIHATGAIPLRGAYKNQVKPAKPGKTFIVLKTTRTTETTSLLAIGWYP